MGCEAGVPFADAGAVAFVILAWDQSTRTKALASVLPCTKEKEGGKGMETRGDGVRMDVNLGYGWGDFRGTYNKELSRNSGH